MHESTMILLHSSRHLAQEDRDIKYVLRLLQVVYHILIIKSRHQANPRFYLKSDERML
jgi:hypothetical protein